MSKSFAATLREFLEPLKDMEVHVDSMGEAMDLPTNHHRKKLHETIKDFVARGELERVADSTYIYKGFPAKKDLQKIMWRKLRAARTVTVDDLMEVSGASQDYVKERLRFWRRKNIVRENQNNTYTLINDPVEMPKDKVKSAKLRRLYQKRKALAACDKFIQAGLEVRMAIAEIEE